MSDTLPFLESVMQQYDYNNRKTLKPGERVEILLPYSEVCMHMQVSDHRAMAELTKSQWPGIQLYKRDGTAYSGSITTGEAGVKHDDDGYYFYPPAPGTNYPWIGEKAA